jgi:hypothetical protein
MALQLPDLDSLSLHDIASVRQSGSFAELRAGIAEALDQALGDVHPNDPAWAEHVNAQMKDRLADRREAVRRDAFQSSVLRLALRAGRKQQFDLRVAALGAVFRAGLNIANADGASTNELFIKAFSGAVTGSAMGAMRACVASWREFQRLRDLPEAARTDRDAAAVFRHLCILSPPLSRKA